MNVCIFSTKAYQKFIPLAGYKNKPNSNPNKPNLKRAKMNVKSFITKDYRKKDDFIVRINKPNFSKNPKCTQTYILQRIMKMKPPSGPKKQTQNKANSKPALSVVEWANPELAEALSAAEGAVEKFLNLWSASVTIIRKSVIRQVKRARLDWLFLGTITKIILEHSPVGAVLYLEVLASTWR